MSDGPVHHGGHGQFGALSPDDKGYDWWRDSTVRYAGYANELGEAFRPLIHPYAVYASYAVAIGYSAGDAADKTRLALAANDNDWRHGAAAGTSAALWQTLASVTVPAFFVNKQVAMTSSLLKGRPATGLLRFVPTVSGLALIPFLPYVLDPPITQVVDAVTSLIEPKKKSE
eukprot:Rhum_TRINITY_DN14319_c0_g1::Rhum_TRINITY_DN14319_c0_g1_i1::g.81638::m.81638/K17981/MTFP1, MTP18; mitochondrial fission process protein 1